MTKYFTDLSRLAVGVYGNVADVQSLNAVEKRSHGQLRHFSQLANAAIIPSVVVFTLGMSHSTIYIPK